MPKKISPITKITNSKVKKKKKLAQLTYFTQNKHLSPLKNLPKSRSTKK